MSKVRAEEYTDKSGTGAPNFSKGIVVSAGSSAGIGSTFPDRTLHVAQANSTAYSSTDFDQKYHVLKLQNFTDDKSVGLQFKIGTNGEAAITAQESSNGETQLMFGTRGSGNRAERVRITSDGHLGIGTNSPVGNLTVHDVGVTTFRISTAGVLAYDHTFNGTTYTIANNNGGAGVPIVFGSKTSGGESARFNASGNLAFPNGQGVDFSASEGSGATSSLLDDYEEGTWTPVFSGSITAGTYTPAVTFGRYVKIGRLVHAQFRLQNITTTSAGSGLVEISGLPYATPSASESPQFTQVSGNLNLENFALDANCGNISLFLDVNATKFTIRQTRDSLIDLGLTVADKVDDSADIEGTITYMAAT